MYNVICIDSSSLPNHLWTRLSGTSLSDGGYGIAIENLTNDIYITGFTSGSLDGQPNNNLSDIFLMKYSSNGTKLWTRLSGTLYEDVVSGIAIDNLTGNIYLTGYTEGSLDGQPNNGLRDIFLMKYTSNGTKLWTRLSGTSARDEGNGIAIDNLSNDIYITGYTEGSLDGQSNNGHGDIFLMKYSSNGAKLWTRLYGTFYYEGGNGIAIDNSTNDIYITGYTGGSLDSQPNNCIAVDDIFLMKCSSNGTILWTRLSGTSTWDEGKAIAIDKLTNDIYITGPTEGSLDGQSNNGGKDIFLIKYSSNGTKLWTKLSGTPGYDESRAIAIDNLTSDIYLTGYVDGSLDGQPYNGNVDIFVMKFSSNGPKLWTILSGTSGVEYGNGIAIDNLTGNIYLTGLTGGHLDGQPNNGNLEIFLSTYDCYECIPNSNQTCGVCGFQICQMNRTWGNCFNEKECEAYTTQKCLNPCLEKQCNSFCYWDECLIVECDEGSHCTNCTCDPWHISTIPSSIDCIANYTCGDNKQQNDEECDGGTYCSSCICDPWYMSTIPLSKDCIANYTCGNNKQENDEECDRGIGCFECSCNIGYTSTVPPSSNCQLEDISSDVFVSNAVVGIPFGKVIAFFFSFFFLV